MAELFLAWYGMHRQFLHQQSDIPTQWYNLALTIGTLLAN